MKRILFTIIIVLLSTAINAQQFKKRLPKETYKKENRLFKTDNSISKTDRFIFNMKTKNAAVSEKRQKLNSIHINELNPNIPLSANGKLLSPDGHEVDFRHPTKIPAGGCWTPSPFVNGEAKDAGCAFTVSCDNPANRDVSSFASIKYVELVWHVMWSGGASSNIDQTRIDDLMTELNADFASYNVIFCADPANFYEDAGNYNHDENTEEVSLKTTYNVTPTQVVNIYVVGSMGPGGYARFPYDPMGGTSSTGGVVLNRGNCNVGTHTLAHEMGHTFGLEHTFAGVDERSTCSSCYEKVRNVNGSSNTSGVATPLGGPYLDEGDREGDWCSDTHPHATNSYDCTSYTNPQQACDAFAPANPEVNNHMSYSFCSTTFTDQQSRRMHCMIDSYLGSWTANGGGVCGTLPPVADFSGTPTSWVSPALVNFTDLSTPPAIIDSVEWIFDVAASGTVTCAGCTGTNARWIQDLSAVGTLSTPPTVTYTNVGLYSVSLTVYSTNGNDTETKIDYIEVITTGSDCDTLDADWTDIGPNPAYYTGAYGYFTGVPSEGSALPEDPAGYYQQYFTPNPGTSVVGSVVIGLGLLNDADDDMTFQVVVFEDDGAGLPDFGAGPVAVQAYSPTQIGVPTGAFYNVFTIPLTCAPTIIGTTFHVGVEMFPGDPTDELVLLSNTDGEGGSPLSNSYSTSLCGDGDFNIAPVHCAYAGVDFDLLCYPIMGWSAPSPYASGFSENVFCDTTDVTINTGTFYDGTGCSAPSGPNTGILNWSYTFSSDGATINSTTEVASIPRTYLSAGPDTLTITAINECGRADTTAWIIPYNFLETPDADFTKDLTNPICLTDQPITFNANTAGYTDYSWDFGDGTTLSGTDSSPTHSYAAVGTYYVNLTVTSPGYQPSDTTYLEDFESGIPGTWTTLDNNSSVGNVAAIFDGTNATAWVDTDLDGAGDQEAWSTGWNNPITTPSDDWLISPNIAITGNNSLAWDGESFSAGFPDAYEVYVVGGGGATVANCLAGQLVFSTGGENAFTTQHVVNLPSYGFSAGNIKVCFRNNSGGDQAYLAIDNVRVGTTGPGCINSEQKLDFVEIVDCSIAPPSADGDANPISGCSPLTVNFSDVTSIGDPATSWLWNFGDGTFSTLQSPGSHIYTSTGTYNVIFEACNAGGCTTENITITVSGFTEDPSYSYSSISECLNGTDISATLSGTLGGVFTSIPAIGINLNSTSGLIDVSASAPGIYDVTYTTTGPCPADSTITVTINSDNPHYSYSSLTECQSGADIAATITGTAGGFSFSPAGLSIDPTSGLIDVSASADGVYDVTYTTTGACPADSTLSITITADDDASYSYSSLAECQSGADIAATITGTAGGFSFSPVGLSIDPASGLIDVSASADGVYDVTYTTTGTCPTDSTLSITITADDDASYSYSSLAECQSGADIAATITGTAGGFSFSPAGLAIDPTSGLIDVSASADGVYDVTYTTTGACPADSTLSVTITAEEEPSFK
ncbi:MAG: M57 family metalloprotease [Flavobacteriales bacterium]|nr:M57 family metalloprotease [Flavobacteriales bacterium]